MDALLTRWLPNVDWTEIGYASLDTLNMLGGSLLFTVLLGLPLGVLLFLCGPRQLFEQKALYGLLSLLVNVLRSVPFVILLILMIPLTVLITGTSLGVAGAIPPLVVGATPFFARLVETALREVDRGIIEATQAMGASTLQIIFRALLRRDYCCWAWPFPCTADCCWCAGLPLNGCHSAICMNSLWFLAGSLRCCFCVVRSGFACWRQLLWQCR